MAADIRPYGSNAAEPFLEEGRLMNDRDQWKTEGDCSMCRRQEYCSHRCKKAKVRDYLTLKGIERGLQRIGSDKLIEKIKGAE